MKLLATTKGDQNKSMIDPWTAVHFGIGLAAGLVGANFWWSMSAAVAYEVAEQYFEQSAKGQRLFKTSGPEIPANAIFDVLVFGGGYKLGERWNHS